MTNDQNATEREAKIFQEHLNKLGGAIPFTHKDVGTALKIKTHEGISNRIKTWIKNGWAVEEVVRDYKKYFWKGITK